MPSNLFWDTLCETLIRKVKNSRLAQLSVNFVIFSSIFWERRIERKFINSSQFVRALLRPRKSNSKKKNSNKLAKSVRLIMYPFFFGNLHLTRSCHEVDTFGSKIQKPKKKSLKYLIFFNAIQSFLIAVRKCKYKIRFPFPQLDYLLHEISTAHIIETSQLFTSLKEQLFVIIIYVKFEGFQILT